MESNYSQTKIQLDLFSKIRTRLDPRTQSVQQHVLDILTSKVELSRAKLYSLAKIWAPHAESGILQTSRLSKRQRTEYTLQKHTLDQAINDLESWQRLSVNPLWFAIVKVQSRAFDKELYRGHGSHPGQTNGVVTATMVVRDPLRDSNSARIFLSRERLESAQVIDIAHGTVRALKVDGKLRLLDTSSSLSRDTVRELAVRLRGADPLAFGLLKCLGAIDHERGGRFSLLFRIPDHMSEPMTLRETIMSRNVIHSLSDRFRLATQLARAVLSVHSFDMVHKSVQPENVVLFRDQESSLGSAFLLGFEQVRRQIDDTRLVSDLDWVKNIYRHPQRQGAKIRDRYIIQHDIYSLGVCLLEIGLWTSFIKYDADDHEPTKSHIYDLRLEDCNDFDRPETVKSCLISLAEIVLPQKMGTRYARIVESCLTCLDVGNEDFGDETEFAEDDASVAIRYIEKVCIQREPSMSGSLANIATRFLSD